MILKLTYRPHFSLFMSKIQYFALVSLLLFQFCIGFYLSSANNQPQNTTPTSNDIDNTPPNLKPERILKVGDSILYRVLEDKDEACTLPVTESGEIMVPYYGPLMASGKTPDQLAEEIKNLLENKFYEKATVSLTILAAPNILNTGTVYLGGKVNRIGSVQLDPVKQNTVAKIILSAGGFSDFANDKDVRVVRKIVETSQTKIFHINVAAVLNEGRLEEDFEVQDGDFIIVPKRLINW